MSATVPERRRGEAPNAPAFATASLPDATVHYRRRGHGSPLLFLHGSHAAGLWLPFHEQLAGSVDLIAPVLPGFEEGEPPRWLQGFDDAVLLYRDLLDALGLERVHLAGHALGAWLAADFAIFSPGRVASLSLLSPLGLRVPGRPPADYLAVSPERLAELLGSDALLPDFDDAEEFARYYGELGVSARLIWEHRYDLKLERRLPRVTAPALILQGEDDALLPRAHAERWAELLNAPLELIGNSGHLPHADQPRACVAAIEGLLR